MTPRLRTTILATALVSMFALPAVADAQGRRVAVIRSRPAVRVGVYYGPSIRYRPWYGSGFGYYPFYGYGYNYGFGLGYGYGYGYGYYPWYPPYSGYYDNSSSLRLQVSPRETQVFVDGYYAGTVDDFDGAFQRLRLEPGQHDLELFMPGHRSFTQKIYLQPVNTFRVRHTMEPLGAGEAEPVRPVATPPPSAGATSQTGQAGQAGPYGTPRARGPRRPLPPRDRDQSRDRDQAAARESDFGSIALRVQPGDVTVTIDGERWEGAQDQDRLVVELEAGTHNVEIRKDGYRSYITDITVRRGETTALNVSLTKQ